MRIHRHDFKLQDRTSTPSQDPQQRTTAARIRAMDARSLRTVFFDLLGRPPLSAERETWSGRGLDELLDELLGSRPFWSEWWAEQLYYFLLIDRFRPETEAARAIPEKLAEGRLSVRDALHRLALTSSFELRNPGADTFVTVVMEQFCGMTVQDVKRELELGKAAYDGRSARFLGHTIDSQAGVVKTCIESKQAARHLVSREYERYLKQPIPKERQIADARRFFRDPYEFLSLVREWFLSPEYLMRLNHPVPESNRLFVRGIFVDLLDRLPTDEEMEPMRYALDGLSDARPLRAVLVQLLIDGEEVRLPTKESLEDPAAWIDGLFRRLLGRPAAEDELAQFTRALKEPECRTRTVVYALMTSREYYSY